MPRLSPRRLFLYLACGISGLLLLLNIEQRIAGGFIPLLISQQQAGNKQHNEDNLSRKLTAKEALTDEVGRRESTAAKEVSNSSSSNNTTPEENGPQPEVSAAHSAISDVRATTAPAAAVVPTRPAMSLDRRGTMEPSDTHIPTNQEKAWYMQEGQLRPQPSKINERTGEREAKVFPEEAPGEDRITDQLMFVPPGVPEHQEDPAAPLKKILLYNGASSWGGLVPGRGVFLKDKCPVSTCVISSNRDEAESADLVLFKDHFAMPGHVRPSHQIWMMYLLECPLHTQIFRQTDVFNWTSTYRTDSTIVAPYERWQLFNENVKTIDQRINYAANKTKQVAWFVSNCGARNGRLEYAMELAKHIGVDIFGACGTKQCPRSDNQKCFSMLNTDYKFYLAFENSNCKDYITEKFFVNGLGHDILPIAMGARLEDYERSAPYKSFIHVDQFAGPKELAEYLHMLDKDDDKYNEYFQWKGTGEFINTWFFCRVCAMLHDNKKRQEFSQIHDINEWWRGEGTCVNGPWHSRKQLAVEEEGAEEKEDEEGRERKEE